MTDAIKVIRTEKECVLRQNTDECNRCCEDCDLLLPTEDVLKGYDMAISALKQTRDTVSRGVFEQVMWERDIAIEQLYELGYELGQKIESCDNTISREAVLSKIKEVCFSKKWLQFRIDKGSNGQRDFLINYIEQLPSVTVWQAGCDKCAMNGSASKYCDNCKYKRQTGEWIDDGFYAEGHSHKAFHCSKCGHSVLGFKEDLSNFCPNCYAKMESKE